MEINSMNLLSQIRAVNTHAPTIIPLVCPACRREGNFQPLGQDLSLHLQPTPPKGNKFVVVGHRQCPNFSCATHVFIVYEDGTQQLLSTYPAGRIDFDTSGVPQRASSAFDEALTCAANECYVAAGMLIRKTLEAVCEHHAAKGTTLADRIADLKTKVILPSILFEAMTHLRLLGNDAAHIDARTFDSVGKDEIAAAIELTKEIIKSTYQYKDLVGKLTALKKP
jgi:hypothetical protein